MRHLPEEWVKYVADEFSLYAATRQHTKAGRVAVIEEQRKSNANSAPSPLVWNEMIVFSRRHRDALRAPAVPRQGDAGVARFHQAQRTMADGGQLPDLAAGRARQNDLEFVHEPQHAARFLHRLRRGRPGDCLRPARGRHRAHRRLGHSVSESRRRAAQSGRREIRRAAGVVGGRRSRADRHDHLGGDRGLEPGGGAFGRAASVRQSLLSRHQFGLARPQAGNRQAARRARRAISTSRWWRRSTPSATARPCWLPARMPRRPRRCCARWRWSSRSSATQSAARRQSR